MQVCVDSFSQYPQALVVVTFLFEFHIGQYSNDVASEPDFELIFRTGIRFVICAGLFEKTRNQCARSQNDRGGQ